MRRQPVCHDILALRRAGATYREISALTGKPMGAIYRHLVKAENRDWLERRRRPEVQRACLRCRRLFASAGPHNRMCDACRTDSVSPYAPD